MLSGQQRRNYIIHILSSSGMDNRSALSLDHWLHELLYTACDPLKLTTDLPVKLDTDVLSCYNSWRISKFSVFTVMSLVKILTEFLC